MTVSADRAKVWVGMLRGALERGDYAAAASYARHIAEMADVLRGVRS